MKSAMLVVVVVAVALAAAERRYPGASSQVGLFLSNFFRMQMQYSLELSSSTRDTEVSKK